MSKMRLKADRSSNKRRGWRITTREPIDWLNAYDIEIPDKYARLRTAPPHINVSNVSNVETSVPEPPTDPEREVFYL